MRPAATVGSGTAGTGTDAARRARPWRSRAGSAAALCALGAALWALARALPGTDALLGLGRAALAAAPLLGTSGFLLGGAALSAIGLPRQSVALVGGYLFGALAGTALALVATLAGAALAHGVAARLGRAGLDRCWPALGPRLDAWTREDAFAKTLALRLFPLGSNLATNLGAGVARVPRGPFLAASLVGFLPQTLVFALTGHGVGEARAAPVLLGAALMGASTALALWTVRRRRPRRAR